VQATSQQFISIKKLGYEPVGIRKNYYQDNHEDAIMMNLESEAYTKILINRSKNMDDRTCQNESVAAEIF
jgi:hypothetical protein